MSIKLVSNKKIAETSSLGNQEKWRDNGVWYKLDQFGYEALAETLVSRLLERSSIEQDTPFTFVRYRMERVFAHGRERTGCASDDFLAQGQALITLNRLLSSYLGAPLSARLERLPSNKKRIEYLAETTADITGLDGFGRYLTLLFELDSLVLNDDRHLNNIAVLVSGGKYSYCPIFDNGAGLLSNMIVYRPDIEPKGLISTIKARPFCTSFNRQTAAARQLYGRQLKLPAFTREYLMAELRPMLEYYPPRDRDLIAERVCCCILQREPLIK